MEEKRNHRRQKEQIRADKNMRPKWINLWFLSSNCRFIRNANGHKDIRTDKPSYKNAWTHLKADVMIQRT